MPHLTINGLEVTTFRDTVEEMPEDIGDIADRGLPGNIIRTRTGRLRTWRFSTPMMPVATAEPLRKWLEGEGQHWPFANAALTAGTSLSTLGAANSIAGTFTPSVSGGVRDARLNVASGSQFAVRLQNRLGVQRAAGWSPAVHGYTISVWRKFTVAEGTTAAFHHVLLKGAVDFARGASSGNPVGLKQYRDGVLGSYGLGRSVQVSATTPFVGLFGKLTTDANAAVDYSDLHVLPFEVPDAWVAQIYAEAQLRDFSSLPKVRAAGDFVEDPDPIDVICRVRSIPHATGDAARVGTVVSTNRILNVDMWETI